MPDEFGKFAERTLRGKLARWFYIAAGSVSLVLGVIGVFVPLIPTTPFLLVSAACYIRGSTRLYDWLLRNRWFGQRIKDWREGRGISRKDKLLAVGYTVSSIAVSAIFFAPNWWIRVLMGILALGLSVWILKQSTKHA